MIINSCLIFWIKKINSPIFHFFCCCNTTWELDKFTIRKQMYKHFFQNMLFVMHSVQIILVSKKTCCFTLRLQFHNSKTLSLSSSISHTYQVSAMSISTCTEDLHSIRALIYSSLFWWQWLLPINKINSMMKKVYFTWTLFVYS